MGSFVIGSFCLWMRTFLLAYIFGLFYSSAFQLYLSNANWILRSASHFPFAPILTLWLDVMSLIAPLAEKLTDQRVDFLTFVSILSIINPALLQNGRVVLQITQILQFLFRCMAGDIFSYLLVFYGPFHFHMVTGICQKSKNSQIGVGLVDWQAKSGQIMNPPERLKKLVLTSACLWHFFINLSQGLSLRLAGLPSHVK